jgi:hypothetical protein
MYSGFEIYYLKYSWGVQFLGYSGSGSVFGFSFYAQGEWTHITFSFSVIRILE